MDHFLGISTMWWEFFGLIVILFIALNGLAFHIHLNKPQRGDAIQPPTSPPPHMGSGAQPPVPPMPPPVVRGPYRRNLDLE